MSDQGARRWVSVLKRLVLDPLVHFLVAGGLLFFAWNHLNATAPPADQHHIQVDRAAILQFMQYRTRDFNEVDAIRRLDSLSPEALADVVQDFVREEALSRSALALGLDSDDYVIKQRLVQKMVFMAEGVSMTRAAPSEAELLTFYQQRAERYQVPGHITFTHVFFSAVRHGEKQAQGLAEQMLTTLNREKVAFSGAPSFGDRFPYQVNYVERTYDAVAGHFGNTMADALFRLDPHGSDWRGPYRSSFGSHLVLLIARSAARSPVLDDVREQVVRDYQDERSQEEKIAFIERLMADFTVDVSADLQRPQLQ